MSKIYLAQSNQQIIVNDGERLLDILAGYYNIQADCGGKGTCGKCKIKIQGVTPQVTKVENKLLSNTEIQAGIRLACQVKTGGEMVVEVDNCRPADKSFLSHASLTISPVIRRVKVALPLPHLSDQRSDWERLRDALAEKGLGLESSLGLTRKLTRILRQNNFSCVCLCYDEKCIMVAAPDEEPLLGIAFDLGTTTILGMLYDLENGKPLSISSRTNPQVAYGADIISRLEYALADPKGLARLQEAVLDALNTLIEELCHAAGVNYYTIADIVVVGNTVMHHLLGGIDPGGLAAAPFVAAQGASISIQASGLGLEAASFARVYLGPNIGGFIGSDTAAVILATHMFELPETENSLAVDLGTNGEIVLGNSKSLLACSTAAGPAFEGAKLRFGMRGAPGAIQGVEISNGEILLDVIGGGQPKGICGSGAVDLLAELLQNKLIDNTGRLCSVEEISDPRLASRIKDTPDGLAFVLAFQPECGLATDLYFSQKDIRELQLAKAAIAAGINLLIETKGLHIGEVKFVYLAGAFGNYVNPVNAVKIGLLPRFPVDSVISVGNAAGTGAAELLMDFKKRKTIEEITIQVQVVNLASEDAFQNRFADAMYFSSENPIA